MNVIYPHEARQVFPHAVETLSDDPSWQEHVEGKREFWIHLGTLYHAAFENGSWNYGRWEPDPTYVDGGRWVAADVNFHVYGE